jgi:shikimate kinase
MPSIFLIGFMGSGKSTVGAELADALGLPFVDLDAVIGERLGATIRRIFADQGEEVFRKAETEALRWAAALDDTVIAVGGGGFSSEVNRGIIRSSGGVSVFLDLPWRAIRGRLPAADPERPKYGNEVAAEKLFENRQAHYRQATATIQLDGSEPPVEVVRRLCELLVEAPCAT